MENEEVDASGVPDLNPPAVEPEGEDSDSSPVAGNESTDMPVADVPAAEGESQAVIPAPPPKPVESATGNRKGKRSATVAKQGGRGKRNDGREVVTSPATSDARSVLDGLEVVGKDAEISIDSLLPCDVREKGSDKRRIAQLADSFTNNLHVANVVVVETPDGKRWLVDGNHRAKAALVAGRTTIKADVYRGSNMDRIRVALESNRVSTPLRPWDIVHAATLAQKVGEKTNISELAVLAGVCRQTVRKYINQMNDSSLAAGVRGMKAPKSDKEMAAELAGKVIEAVEIGNDQVIDLTFERLSPDCRAKTLDRLRRRYPDALGEALS